MENSAPDGFPTHGAAQLAGCPLSHARLLLGTILYQLIFRQFCIYLYSELIYAAANDAVSENAVSLPFCAILLRCFMPKHERRLAAEPLKQLSPGDSWHRCKSICMFLEFGRFCGAENRW